MPELPEIETVRLQLAKVLVGRKILTVEVRNPKTFQGEVQQIQDKQVVQVRRRAKVLLIDLEGGVSMAFHFKMSGQLIYDLDGANTSLTDRVVGGHPTADFVSSLPSPHTRVIFVMDRGVLYFNDQRKFGWIKAGPTVAIEAEKFFEGLGPEPFDLSEAEFVARVSRLKKPVKLVIMDQSIVTGVGNIYANDALWEAAIDPKRPAQSLSADVLKRLFQKILLVLTEGIKYGGATAADAKYIDLHGLGGHYQEHFRTYDQAGKRCPRNDGGVIEKFVLGGRGTYFCPKCQV